MNDKWFTMKEVAEQYKVSKTTISNRIKKADFPAEEKRFNKELNQWEISLKGITWIESRYGSPQESTKETPKDAPIPASNAEVELMEQYKERIKELKERVASLEEDKRTLTREKELIYKLIEDKGKTIPTEGETAEQTQTATASADGKLTLGKRLKVLFSGKVQ